MRVIVIKLFIWLHVAMTVNSIGDQNANIESKNAYIESELKLRGGKGHQNRYASVLMANSKNSKSSSSTTQRSPWLHQPSSSSKYSYGNLNSVHLRHARYPTLNSVLTRLDQIQTRHVVATTTSTTTTTTTPPPKYQYQKFYRMSDNLLTENYGSDELDGNDVDNDDDNLPDYDSWGSEKDEEEEEDDEEEDDDFFRRENGWQAEEATTAAPLGRPPSSSNLELTAAVDHIQRMNIDSRCRDPLPRVLSIQNIHPSPEKKYLPHCTVLHRCSADTGCCKNHSMTCAPKHHSIVYLYFFTTMLSQPSPKVEKLPFVNHTECACLDKSDGEPPTLETATTETSRDGIRSYRSNISVRAADSSLYSPETIRRCKCPKEYNSMLDRDNNCSCDCDDDNEDCVRFKKGKEHFSLSDRRCIMNAECGVPKCEYGPYMRMKGRCTDKTEKLDAFASVSSNF